MRAASCAGPAFGRPLLRALGAMSNREIKFDFLGFLAVLSYLGCLASIALAYFLQILSVSLMVSGMNGMAFDSPADPSEMAANIQAQVAIPLIGIGSIFLSVLCVILMATVVKYRAKWFYISLWMWGLIFLVPMGPIGWVIAILLAIHLIRKKSEYFAIDLAGSQNQCITTANIDSSDDSASHMVPSTRSRWTVSLVVAALAVLFLGMLISLLLGIGNG